MGYRILRPGETKRGWVMVVRNPLAHSVNGTPPLKLGSRFLLIFLNFYLSIPTISYSLFSLKYNFKLYYCNLIEILQYFYVLA